MAGNSFMQSKAMLGDLTASEETQLVVHLQDAESQNLKLREQLLKLRNVEKENERLREENARLRASATTADVSELEKLREEVLSLKRQLQSSPGAGKTQPITNVSVKTHFRSNGRDDVRCWTPITNHPFKELLEFVELSYDSTYYFSYRDLDGDNIRISSDEDCIRAFRLAQNNNWDTIKFNVQVKAEEELRKEIVSLELRNKKLKQKLKKIKTSQTGMKKGQILLDAIYHNRKKDFLTYG